MATAGSSLETEKEKAMSLANYQYILEEVGVTEIRDIYL